MSRSLEFGLMQLMIVTFIFNVTLCMFQNTLALSLSEPLNQMTSTAPSTETVFAVTAKLISAFVFATQIVQSLFFLNPKFQVL